MSETGTCPGLLCLPVRVLVDGSASSSCWLRVKPGECQLGTNKPLSTYLHPTQCWEFNHKIYAVAQDCKDPPELLAMTYFTELLLLYEALILFALISAKVLELVC